MEHPAKKPSSSSSSSSNKITEIVRLQQMLRKWKKLASAAPRSNYKFLKKTLSFSADTSSHHHLDPSCSSSSSSGGGGGGGHAVVVPKGFFVVSVGEEQKRFVIPTEYLSHSAFEELLREAEEEFGFQHEGVLRIPCEVGVFESILKVVAKKKKQQQQKSFCYCSCEAELGQTHHPQKPICR
ncbi:auxin-responsive protein SAUR50-like [Ananas comosus]|uniref:Auxin-responsive protein SAUR50-like n=1 Tax=Ananas comosus TaxID=4615 RepID=A0A6P5EQ08_ANACO|nr:auxin-responsive protein SAUR50-like [Ananas comosus]